jgi:hypothetical protein
MVKHRTEHGCQNVPEPAISTPDGNIENQVEFLIERCILPAIEPRIQALRAVLVFTLEMAAVPEVLFREVDVENLLKSIVDPCVKVIFIPL